MKVYVERASVPGQLARCLQKALAWVGGDRIVQPGARVFIKPNLTWRVPMPGVTTTPEFIEAVVSVFRQRTDHITIGEADGGYHLFEAEEAFQSHRLYDLSRQYGVKILNLSREPAKLKSVMVGGRTMAVELPEMLLDSSIDVFVTLPVPKVHAMTGVSMGFKNQWGCQPGTMRLRNHPQFSMKILAINKLLKPSLAVYDGTYFLDRTGPMIGEPIRMNLVVVADDVGAGDMACCEIMGIKPSRIRHLQLARDHGMMPKGLSGIVLNQPLAAFKTHQFRLKRSVMHWVALGAFHSNLVTRLFYDSIAAGPLHKVLYTIRRNHVIGRLLYGSAGPPEIEGRR